MRLPQTTRVALVGSANLSRASLLLATFVPLAKAEFSAYNDIASGPATHPNTTVYAPNATSSGLMKDILTGENTSITLTVSESGVSYESSTAVPAVGTDADDIFGGFVDFSTGNPHSLAINGNDVFTYAFSGLDAASKYEFAGTACRGNYDERWTLVRITGADSFTAAHSSGLGIVTAGLAANEVAIWTGANHNANQGFVVQWTDIDPGADGTFQVESRQYTGPTPGVGTGNAGGSKGYALNGIRLKESFIVGQPTVVNTPASSITSSGATIGGEVTVVGTNTPTITLCWGNEDAGNLLANWDHSISLGSQSGVFLRVLSGLNPAEDYYFRAFAQNTAAGIWASPTQSFQTLALPPAIENVAATNLLGTSAEIGANVTVTGGNPPTVTLFYGTTDGGTDPANWTESLDLGVQAGSANNPISGLTPNTTYYFRARAVNSGGTAWASSTASFATPQVTLAQVSNQAATGVTGISAVLRGEITDAGFDPPAVTIYYGLADGGSAIGAWESLVQIGVQSGSFSRFVGNLASESTYYFRARASNAAGDQWATPSLSFTTPVYIPPTIVINEIHYDEDDKTERAEFIELVNVSASPVSLVGWELEGGVRYTFGVGASIPANGFLVIAENPATMQSKFGYANSIGPWAGSLKNSGETITLSDSNGNEIDSVDYKLGFPWPTVGDPISNVSPSIQLINPAFDNEVGGTWRSASPTPGLQNSILAANAPPSIRQVDYAPIGRVMGTDKTILPGEDVRITAKVTDPDGLNSVSLDYQLVNPGDYIDIDDPRYNSGWVSLTMNDNGTGGDEFAGDDIYSGTISAALNTHRRMIRFRIEAADSAANNHQVPYPDDPVPNFAYFVYGTMPTWTASNRPGVPSVTYDFSAMEPVAVYQLLTTRSDHEDSQHIPSSTSGTYGGSDYLWDGALVYEGKVYDHIRYRARGGVWRYAMGKNMWKFDFNRGHRFSARDDQGKKYKAEWNKLNFSALITQGNFGQRGEQGLFEGAGFKNHNLAGTPAPLTNYAHFRIIESADENGADQFSSDFQGLYMAIEQLDGQFTEQHDLPDGYLWKIEGNNNQTPANNQGSYLESSLPNGDVDDFIAGYRNGSPTTQWWHDHLDLNSYYNFRASATWVHDYDIHAGKNYFFFHNPDNDKWQVVNWDLDLTWTTPYRSDPGGPLRDDVLAIPEFQLGYRNQVRHLQDLLHNDEQQGMLLDEIAHWVYTPGQQSLVDADRAMWDYNPIMVSSLVNSSKSGHGRFYSAATSPAGSFPGMVAKLKTYVAGREIFMTSTYLNADESSIPTRPTITYTGGAGFDTSGLSFTSSPFSGSGGASFAAQQWRIAEVTLPDDPRFDSTDAAYDRYAERKYEIEADWETGDIPTADYAVSIPPVAVRPGNLYRVRTKMMDSQGRWSHWSQPVEFTASQPDISDFTDHLRITEIMYHPPEPTGPETGISTNRDDYEYIELKNVGSSSLDLRSVRFTKGVDFDFGGSAIETLEAGDYVLVVKNIAAFEARYGTGLPIAGEFDGNNLSNGGEQLKLSFGAGIAIHDIDEYDDKAPWPIAADGDGSSLTLIDPDFIPGPDHNLATSWRASSVSGGSPGSDESGTNYSNWRSANGITDDLGDDDGDNIPNLLEFALASDYTASSTSDLPTAQIEMINVGGVDQQYLTLTFRHRPGVTDLNYIVEFSDNMRNWNVDGVFIRSSPEEEGITLETWRSATPLTGKTQHFGRLRIKLQ
ncbi:MAG: lamin tail domain-containing protein [Akkermansiaceae bacterium]